MGVLYVNATGCAKGKISWSSLFFVWLVTSYVGIIAIGLLLGLFGLIPEVESRAPTPLLIGVNALWIGLFAFFIGMVFLRRRRRSRLKIAAYGKTIQVIGRELASICRSFDRSAGRPRLHRRAWIGIYAIGGLLLFYVPPLLQHYKIVAVPPTYLIFAAPLILLCIGRSVWLIRPRHGGKRQMATSFTYRITTIMIYISGIVPTVLLFSLLREWGIFGDRYQTQQIPEVLGGMAIFGAIAALWVYGVHWANKLAGRASTLALPRPADLRKWDRRRPVVFLRSFVDDSQWAENTGASLFDTKGLSRLEEVIAPRIASYGPLVAIAQPGTEPTPGAAKDYFEGEEWRRAVVKWMDDALLIVTLAGSTPGLRWELSTVLERGHASKLLILFPPDALRVTRWTNISACFAGSAWHAGILSVDPRWALAVHTGSHGLVVVCSEDQEVGDLEVAIDLALYGIFYVDPHERKGGATLSAE
jgi:hypothetical protein